jgi:hypothetical protein
MKQTQRRSSKTSIGNREMPVIAPKILTWEFYSCLIPQREEPKRNKTRQVEKWTLGVVDLPYVGETPVEVVLFVGSAIGFRMYQIWRYYFHGGDCRRGMEKPKNGARGRSTKDWCQQGPLPRPGEPCFGGRILSSVGSNRPNSGNRTPHHRSRWWPWRWFSHGSTNGTTSRDDRPLEPDAKATQYGSYRDPCLAAFMSIAQERKSQLRHVHDPELLRQKRLHAIRTKGRAKPQGPLGLTDHLLRSKRSSLRETVWESSHDNAEQ